MSDELWKFFGYTGMGDPGSISAQSITVGCGGRLQR